MTRTHSLSKVMICHRCPKARNFRGLWIDALDRRWTRFFSLPILRLTAISRHIRSDHPGQWRLPRDGSSRPFSCASMEFLVPHIHSSPPTSNSFPTIETVFDRSFTRSRRMQSGSPPSRSRGRILEIRGDRGKHPVFRDSEFAPRPRVAVHDYTRPLFSFNPTSSAHKS
jgi:hypothetical protein